VLSPVPYRDLQWEQFCGGKLAEQCSPPQLGARESCEADSSTASIEAVWALGVDGMANKGELLLNAVKVDKPKMLIGLTQNGNVFRCWGLPVPQPQPLRTPADRQGLPHPGIRAERGKPVLLPQGTAGCKARSWEHGHKMAEQAKAVW
jgi:hypothetical protein